MCVCDQGGLRGRPSSGRGRCPPFSSPGPSAGRPRWRGPPSLLVTGRAPVTLRNTAQRLPWVLKDPPARAGDTGSLPGPGRPHVPRSNSAGAPQGQSPRSREPNPLKPPGPGARAPHRERPTLHPRQTEESPSLEPPGCWLESGGKAGTRGPLDGRRPGITPSPGSPGAPALPTRRLEPTTAGRSTSLVLSY